MEEKRELIFQAARKLFMQKGYKETNVPEITGSAGVAVGTFYNYFGSKDEIFFEVFNSENEKIKRELMSSISPDDNPLEAMTRLMFLSRDAIASNLILREWYNKDLFSKMEKQFQEGNANGRMNEIMVNYLSDFIQKWQTEGKIRNDLEVGMILALFNSTIYVELHKSEIGIEYFPRLTYLLIESIMKGVTDLPNKPSS
jgi:AcrR family transcriptional regulator